MTDSNRAPTWTAADFGPHLTGSGADKLVTSRVAPLVAAAAGLLTLAKDDPTMRDVLAAKGVHVPKGNNKHVTWVSMGTNGGDGLVIPWSSLDSVGGFVRGVANGPRPDVSMVQLRPATPVRDGKGKAPKYVGEPGSSTCIAVHPSTPLSWLQGGVEVLIAEGAMKGLSVMTAVLVRAGVKAEDLLLTDAEKVADAEQAGVAAADRLRTILDGIPDQQRLLVIMLVGVATWHNHPEWDGLSFKDCQVRVGFDADTTKNPDVHREATRVFAFVERKKGVPSLLRPTIEGDEKAGVDDWLAANDLDLDGLLDTAVDEVPGAPEPEVREGAIRMDLARGVAEEAWTDEHGRTHWQQSHDIAMKVRATRDRYVMTPEHLFTGTPPNVSVEHPGGLQLDAAWQLPDGSVDHGTIDAPKNWLDFPPGQLAEKAESIPTELLLQPSWPPVLEQHQFISAVKRTGWEDRIKVARHMINGFIIAPSGRPLFALGADVIDANGPTDEVESGIVENHAKAAAMFGLHPTSGPEGVGIDAAEVAAAIRETVSVVESVWTRSDRTAMTFATALRAALPLPARLVVMAIGGPAAGKTYWTAGVLQFIRSGLGHFADMKVNTSASGTKYALEQRVAAFPLWAADDGAPQKGRAKADGQEDALNAVIRSIFNGAEDDRGAPGGGFQKGYAPQALLVGSRENALSIRSIVQRTVMMQFTPGVEITDVGHARMKDLARTSLAPAKVFTGAVQVALRQGQTHQDGWAGYMKDLQRLRVRTESEVSAAMAEQGADCEDRDVQKCADILLGLEAFRMLLTEVGLLDEFEGRLAKWRRDIIDSIADQASTSVDGIPGRAFILALRAELATGRCHVAAPGSGKPPVHKEVLGHGEDDKAGREVQAHNQLLGWDYSGDNGPARPLGPRVGHLVWHKAAGWCVLVDPPTLQGLLVRDGGRLPHGTVITSSITAAESEGLTATAAGWPTSKGRHRKMVAGTNLAGHAIPLSALLGTDEDVDLADVSTPDDPDAPEDEAAVDEPDDRSTIRPAAGAAPGETIRYVDRGVTREVPRAMPPMKGRTIAELGGVS